MNSQHVRRPTLSCERFRFYRSCQPAHLDTFINESASEEEQIISQELQNEISFIDALCSHLEKIVEDEVGSGTLTSSSTFRELAIYMVNARAPLDAFIKKFDPAKPSRIKRFTRSAPWRSRKEGLQDLLRKIRNCKPSITITLSVSQLNKQEQAHVREGFMKWLASGDWDINYSEDVPENAETKAATNFLARKAFNELRDCQGGELNLTPCGNMEEGNAVLEHKSAIFYYSFSHNLFAK
ncbi:hypothetical protein M422DRAFT_254728 [Sphaerobolus stellatus SS14]|uniref:Uncharacterized protein n=1 Tax=Sphaerobolus stellatus (strain SS14) TaxID=990650 RepID=A0A0C9VK69_SPHS4|nr:hypothetical protein M422DRAFT_254728 [Sphaerobolus stellatus SS14]